MVFNAEIPHGAYWRTSFAKWQGSFANLNAVEFVADVARRETSGRMQAVKSRNPSAVGDIFFARATGVDAMVMNEYGSSPIWGRPQGPTATRSIIETVEELAMRAGGCGLFEGCAAGDTAMAVVIKVGDP